MINIDNTLINENHISMVDIHGHAVVVYLAGGFHTIIRPKNGERVIDTYNRILDKIRKAMADKPSREAWITG